MRHLLSYMLVSALVVSCLAGCRQRQEPPQSRPQPRPQRTQRTVRLSLMPTLDCLPFYYAAAAGIYDSLGIDVRLATRLSQFDCDTALLGNSADGSISDLVRTRSLLSRGDSLEAVMETEGSRVLVTCGKLRIKSVRHLKNRMVAVSRHSAADFYSLQALAPAKMKYGDIFRPQINDINLRAAMLDDNQVDAAVLPEPQATAACRKGHRRIYTGGRDSLRLGCLTFRKKALDGKGGRENLRLLLRGYDLAVAVLNRKGGKVCRDLLRDVYKLPPEIADTLSLPLYRPSRKPGDEGLRRAAAFLQSTK